MPKNKHTDEGRADTLDLSDVVGCNDDTGPIEKPTYPTVVLSNTLKIMNLSSPHDFTFEDGSVLPACSHEQSDAGRSKTAVETHIPELDIGPARAVSVHHVPDDKLTKVLDQAEAWADKHNVDIILSSRIVLDMIKESDRPTGKFRGVRLKCSIKKVLCIDTFCV